MTEEGKTAKQTSYLKKAEELAAEIKLKGVEVRVVRMDGAISIVGYRTDGSLAPIVDNIAGPSYACSWLDGFKCGLEMK